MNREPRTYALPVEVIPEEYNSPSHAPTVPGEDHAPPGNGWKGIDPERVGMPLAEQFQQTGDPQLLDQLLALYYAPLKKFSERVHFNSGGRNVLHAVDSEDVAHDAIAKVLNRVRECQENGKALPLLRFRYFTHTTTMLYIDHSRRRQTRKTHPVNELPEVAWSNNGAPVDVAQLAIRRASVMILKDTLAVISEALSEPYREIAFDRWRGKTVPEIAATHGLHPSKVQRIMRKVNELISPLIEEKGWMRDLIVDDE